MPTIGCSCPQRMLKEEGGLGSILGCSVHFRRARFRPPTQPLWFSLPFLRVYEVGKWAGTCRIPKLIVTREPSPAGGLAKSISRPGWSPC